MLLALALLGCSASSAPGFDYAKIRKLALESTETVQPLSGHEEYVLIPSELAGDIHKLIVYPEGVSSSIKTAIFQLSHADIPGLEDNVVALRHGAGDFVGDKYVGVWSEGELAGLHPVNLNQPLPELAFSIARDEVPELAVMTVTAEKPVQGLKISDPAKATYARLKSHLATQNEADVEPLSQELIDLQTIFETTPLLKLSERRADYGLDRQVLLMVWDDGYDTESLKNVDPDFSQVLVATNFGSDAKLVTLPKTHEIRLHPGQTSGADGRVRQTQITHRGVVVPAHTSAVLVRVEHQ